MQDRPTARELLATIADLLEGDVLEATTGGLKHRVRVAGSLCRIVERELVLGADAQRREVELLAGVLGVAAQGSDAAALCSELDERLARGGDAELERRAWLAVLEIVRGKLAIAKPGYDDYDFSGERPD